MQDSHVSDAMLILGDICVALASVVIGYAPGDRAQKHRPPCAGG